MACDQFCRAIFEILEQSVELSVGFLWLMALSRVEVNSRAPFDSEKCNYRICSNKRWASNNPLPLIITAPHQSQVKKRATP